MSTLIEFKEFLRNLKAHFRFGFILFFTVIELGSFRSAHAFTAEVGGGVSNPYTLGSLYQNIDNSMGWHLESLFDFGFTSPSIIWLHARVDYEPFFMRNYPNITLKTFDFLVGAQVTGWGSSFVTPYFGLDVGAAYANLLFTDYPSSIANAKAVFAVQATPGFAVQVAGPVSVACDLPIKVLFFNQKWVIFDPSVSLRIKL